MTYFQENPTPPLPPPPPPPRIISERLEADNFITKCVHKLFKIKPKSTNTNDVDSFICGTNEVKPNPPWEHVVNNEVPPWVDVVDIEPPNEPDFTEDESRTDINNRIKIMDAGFDRLDSTVEKLIPVMGKLRTIVVSLATVIITLALSKMFRELFKENK